MIAPDIFRKRFLIEGYFTIEVNEQTPINYFKYLTDSLELKTYGDPIVHTTDGLGKKENQGYDAFIPLIDSGIYLAIWSNKKFFSLIIYTCKEFDEAKALVFTKEFFKVTESENKLF
ncbi:hypothetical protein [Solitalea koreensis]|uniref:S-adenosylmethionine decarboxylase n=1 Tax=Solitalea koreensis TaxID=543615 RepID=A0A521B9Y4_9SPHI|nr:hypothetical protein [Solitalea koreensis]SMO43831.1 S-adenosylmethionine decarboxylase [Solitalea koreensis]